MKTKMFVLMCLLVLGISFLSHEYTSAQSSSPISKIGVVNVERVLMECDSIKAYAEKARSEIQKIREEQDKIRASLKDIETELASGFYAVGSSDYYKKYRERAEKQEQLNLQDFNLQEQSLKSQIWQIELYNKIIKIANEIGAEKDLYLVLSIEEPEISAQNPDEFTVTVKTHKVLYSGGCMDLTETVKTRLNQQTKAVN